MAKPTSIAARIGFYLLKILFTFLGPWMLTLPSPSQDNSPLVPGQSGSYRPVSGFQTHPTPQSHMQTLPMVGIRTWARSLNHCSSSRKIYQCRVNSSALPWKTEWVIKERILQSVCYRVVSAHLGFLCILPANLQRAALSKSCWIGPVELFCVFQATNAKVVRFA